MHAHFLDPYVSRPSPLHRLDGRVKLVLVLAFILANALTPDGAWPVFLLMWGLALSAELLSEIGVGYVLKRSSLALPFVLAALPLIFTQPGARLDLQLGSIHVALSQPGLVRFASLALKSWISVQAAILLASTTPFPDLLVAMRGLHVPRLLVAIFSLMWRYLFILVDEALRMMRARLARSGQSDLPDRRIGGSLPWRAHVAGGMAGSLFLRAIERSDRIYVAMLARGYDGELRSFPLPALTSRHWLTLLFSLALLAALLGFAYLFWG